MVARYRPRKEYEADLILERAGQPSLRALVLRMVDKDRRSYREVSAHLESLGVFRSHCSILNDIKRWRQQDAHKEQANA